MKALETSYPSIPANDRNYLIKECIVDRIKVNYGELERLMTKYGKNIKPSCSSTFTVLANNIAKEMGSSG